MISYAIYYFCIRKKIRNYGAVYIIEQTFVGVNDRGLKSLIVISFAVAVIGARNPSAAGATSKLLKSFIKIPHTI